MASTSSPDSTVPDEPRPDAELVLRAFGQPTCAAAWGFIGFMATFLAIVGIDMLVHGVQTMVSSFGLLIAVVAGFAVGLWPRPPYLQEARISRQGILAKDRNGRSFMIPAEQVEIIAVEGLFNLATQTYDAWGRLHIRAGKTSLAMQLNPVGIKQTFVEVMDRLPHVLGISGDQQITVPAIGDLSAADEWIERVDRQCRRELGRQVRYAIAYGLLAGAGGFGLAGAMLFTRIFPAVVGARHGLLMVSVLLWLASGGFLTAAWRRWRFLSRVRAQIASVKADVAKV